MNKEKKKTKKQDNAKSFCKLLIGISVSRGLRPPHPPAKKEEEEEEEEEDKDQEQ